MGSKVHALVVSRVVGLIAFCLALSMPALVIGQGDPVIGNWRGTLKSADGTVSLIIMTIVKAGDGYAGSTSGVGENSETALAKVTVNAPTVSIEGVADSKLGAVRVAADLKADGNVLRGNGTVGVGNQAIAVTFDLQRRARQDVAQTHVTQRADYFTGRWKFDYLGGEFPPLSSGERSGTVTFSTPSGTQFVQGTVDGQSMGKPFKETIAIGVNAETKAIAYHERRADGVELMSLGNWTSPLAIVFQTTPLVSGGKTYQLRRVMSVLSETAFDINEEFSVDGGAFRKLGTAHYTKEP
ncbi:MAG: hypothetical protein FJW27_07375 [Acidimicrobiia bacterium]|nr:hypothetical protein [Acidimicrobiia bacterium]